MLTIRQASAWVAAFAAFAFTATSIGPVFAEDGVTATEILLGGTDPFSGPASAYGAVGKGSAAYFQYVNDHGGVNGRKITYKDLDDGYSPPQTVQLTRQLVEQDKVFAIFASLGTACSTAIRPYLNQNKVPQLFVATGASKWAHDAAEFPWTIGWQPDYESEAIIYARNLLKEKPTAKVAIIYQNDDFGQDYVNGFKQGLGSHASLIVKTASYEVTDPDVSSQIASLKSSGADTLLIAATPKFAIQSLVATAQQGWKPQIYLTNVSSAQPIMHAATKAGGGPDATNGVISTQYSIDPADPAKWGNDPGYKLFKEIMDKYVPGADQTNGIYLIGMAYAYTMVDVLKSAGKDLTREKAMKAALSLNETDNPFLYTGLKVVTSPTNHFPITSEALVKYTDGKWVATGAVIDARSIIKSEK
jgi:branched-chain amino acid transport system substrate-binding protein